MADGTASDFRLKPRFTIDNCPGEVFSIRWSQTGNYLAAGCGDGTIRVFTVAENSANLKYNLNVGPADGLPMTAMRFRPISARSKTQNVLLAVNADGTAQHWHITSGRRMHKIVDDDNQFYCVDYTTVGDRFVAAGKDYSVKVYDEGTKILLADMRGGFGSSSPGHSNRVFSVKFVKEDQNLVVSGGWDNTVQIWDTRIEHSVRSFYGPHVCGDSIDVLNGQIVTGSWRPDHQLQLWDLGTGKLIKDIQWTHSVKTGENCQLYATQFSKSDNGRFIAAGGSGSNEAKVFDHENNDKMVGMIAGLPRGVFTLDWCPNRPSLAVAGGDAAIRVFDIVRGS